MITFSGKGLGIISSIAEIIVVFIYKNKNKYKLVQIPFHKIMGCYKTTEAHFTFNTCLKHNRFSTKGFFQFITIHRLRCKVTNTVSWSGTTHTPA